MVADLYIGVARVRVGWWQPLFELSRAGTLVCRWSLSWLLVGGAGPTSALTGPFGEW